MIGHFANKKKLRGNEGGGYPPLKGKSTQIFAIKWSKNLAFLGQE